MHFNYAVQHELLGYPVTLIDFGAAELKQGTEVKAVAQDVMRLA